MKTLRQNTRRTVAGLLARIAATVAALLLAAPQAVAQAGSISTDILGWADFATMNISASASLSRHLSAGISAAWNPWTFPKGESVIYNRTRTAALDLRWWSWYVQSGWWLGAGLQIKEYSEGGIGNIRAEEGLAYGGGLSVGYSKMVARWWNVELSAGLWAGRRRFCTMESVPCGRMEGPFHCFFVAPYNVAVSLVHVIPLRDAGEERRRTR